MHFAAIRPYHTLRPTHTPTCPTIYSQLHHTPTVAASTAMSLQAHAFCPRCGAPTRSVDGGARRQCTSDPAHRAYPRTDPVVIMLVESPDGSKVRCACCAEIC